MTKAKKVLSLVLAVVMVAAMFAVSASASADQTATFTVTPSATTAQIGDVVTVTVALKTDYYAGPTNVPVYYNPDVFEFVAGSVSGTAIFGTGATDVQSYNDATAGCLKVAFIPQSANGATARILSGTLFTFQLKAIANGDSDIQIKAADQKTTTNVGGTLYCGAYATSSVSSAIDMYDQTLAITNAKVTVGAAVVTPTLVVKDTFANASSVIIDKYAPDFFMGDAETTGVIYGIETLGYSNGFETYYALADALTTTAGDDYLRITVVNGEGYETTGTMIEVLDTDKSTVLETYYFVYFGDINGDGYVDNGDGTAAMTYALDDTTLTTIYEVLAGDANGDTYTDNGDGTAIATAVLNDSGFAVQEDVAALFWDAISPEYGI